MDNKPKSMPLLDFFIKKSAIKCLVPENIAEAIIKDQWRTLTKVVKTSLETEVNGIGYFKVSKKKATAELKALEGRLERMITRMNSIPEGPKRDHHLKVIQSTKEGIKNYKAKIKMYEDRFQGTNGGDVQQTSRSAVEEGGCGE